MSDNYNLVALQEDARRAYSNYKHHMSLAVSSRKYGVPANTDVERAVRYFDKWWGLSELIVDIIQYRKREEKLRNKS